MQKEYKNKEIKSDSTKKSDKKTDTLIKYSFPGNPPITIEAKNREDAEEKFNNLKQ